MYTKKTLMLIILLASSTYSIVQITKTEKDSIFIQQIEDHKEPDKVLHAEPLYIDLIRDLGARKGEKEWNVGLGLTDNLKFDAYEALIEYEWAPIDRLGFEVELPFTFYAPQSGIESDSIPSNSLDSTFLGPRILPPYTRNLDRAWTVQNDTLCNYGADKGATPSIFTGPANATSGNNFLYMEADRVIGFNPNNATRSSLLELGCFDFTDETNIELEYKFHMYGRPVLGSADWMGDLYFEVIDSIGVTHEVDFVLGDVQQSNTAPWITRKVNLSNFAGQIVRIAVRGYIVPIENSPLRLGDMVIDDIKVYRTSVSIQENSLESAFQLYPNPNNGNFNLKATSEMIGKSYQIFDMKGSIIHEARIESTFSQIELSNANKGIYFFKIVGTNEVKKLVVQ